jgi:hypothetical protein
MGDHYTGKFRLYRKSDWAKLTGMRWLIRGLIVRHGTTLLYGQPKIGKKSFIGMTRRHIAPQNQCIGWMRERLSDRGVLNQIARDQLRCAGGREQAANVRSNIIAINAVAVIGDFFVKAFLVREADRTAVDLKAFPQTGKPAAREALGEPAIKAKWIAEHAPDRLRFGIVEHAICRSPDRLADHRTLVEHDEHPLPKIVLFHVLFRRQEAPLIVVDHETRQPPRCERAGVNIDPVR